MPDRLTEHRQPIPREEAAQRGFSRFWTGRPCKAGHISERFVSNRQCVACNAQKARERERQKAASDPSFRLYRSVQRRAGQALKGRASPVDALGCGHAALKRHMATKFTEGMVWEKYGQWEVDHITPLSAGRTVEELTRLCHYTNLQPLWKRDNRMKGGA